MIAIARSRSAGLGHWSEAAKSGRNVSIVPDLREA